MENSRTNWEKLEKMTEEEIDYSDIPETDEDFWVSAERSPAPQKVEYTLRLDEDVANWLTGLEKNTDVSINLILRSYMLTAQQLKPLL